MRMAEVAIFSPMENFLTKDDKNLTMGDGNCPVNHSSTPNSQADTENETINNDIIPSSERQTPAVNGEESLHEKIRILKEQMISLRESSVAFRENMEAVLATIQGINQSHGTPWQVEGYNGVEEKLLPHFRHSNEKRLITGIASRIERGDMAADNLLDDIQIPYSYPVTPDGKNCAIISDYANMPSQHDVTEELAEDVNAQKRMIPKRQMKVHSNNNEATRPSSESFTTSNQVNVEPSIPEDERTNSLPLSQGKNTPIKQTLLTHTSKDVGDEATNGLRASETSIDSGYHGGNTGLAPHGRVCSPASPLAKMCDIVEDKKSTKPKIPSYLPLSQTNGNYSQLLNGNMQLKGSESVKSTIMNESLPTAPELPPKKNQTSIKTSKNEVAMKPRVPRSSKKIKMGVSAVTSPLPKTRTIFSDVKTPTSPNPKEDEQKIDPNESDESSVLRRRSMRMMTEFKLFDFSDSAIGIESSIKPASSKNTNKLANIDGNVKVKKLTKEADNNESNPSKNKINRQRRTSVKSKGKFSNEPLPSPPLPPPPPAPPSDQKSSFVVPEFKEFSSIAKDSSNNPVYKVNSNTPVSSPVCTRKNIDKEAVYANSPSGVKQLSQTSFQTSASLAPSNASAFTPVSLASWSDVSLDDLSTPGHYDERYDRGAQRLQQADVKVHTPTPIYPNKKIPESPKPEDYVFQRKGSLPLAAISNRNKYKNQMERTPTQPLTPQVRLKRVQSLRDRRTYNQNPHHGHDLENYPVSFNPDENAKKVIAALRDAGYKRDASWLANAGKGSNPPNKVENESKQTLANNIKRSNSTHHKRDQNVVKERREETIVRTGVERAGRNKSTIDIIRASFRGRRGKSMPTNSSTNASHEFSTGMPTCRDVNQSSATNRDEQSATPPTSRRNSQNKVKHRVDQKPVTPIPEVAKSRRKKQAMENKQNKSSSGISLYEKLRNVALKQQITNNNRKHANDEHSEKRRQRLSSQTSEKSIRTNDSYPSGSLASNASMTSYSSSVNASISSNSRKTKKFSTFV